jgi:hypothetical protein
MKRQWAAFPSCLAGIMMLLGGCTQQPMAPLGNAVANDQAVEVINPDPHWQAVAPDLNGERAALAMRKYLGQQVIKPAEVSTTQSVSQ